MTLLTRVDRLEDAIGRRDCPESHVRLHVTRVAVAGQVRADPEPAPCSACGGDLDVTQLVLEVVPSRRERPCPAP
jgi:hypothetical protein